MESSHPYSCCNVCYASLKDTPNLPLYLTSCAHILCREHISKGEHINRTSDSSKITCPVCRSPHVSLIRIDDSLPQEIQPFFNPFPNQIEQLYATAQFQYCAMADRISYQSEMITKLVQKTDKQKSLLLLAKEKISQIDQFERRIKQLENENQILKSRSPGLNISKRPETIDLTCNDLLDNAPSYEQNKKAVSTSFVNSMKQSSSQRFAPSYNYSISENQRSSIRNLNDPKDFNTTKTGAIAESSNIIHQSPRLSKNRPQSVFSTGHRFGTPNSQSSLNLSSRDSFNSPYNKNNDKPQDRQNLSTDLKSYKPNELNRIGKSRASTAQLAQKLSSHMKIGMARGSSARTQSSMSSRRPGSAFNQNMLFNRKR